MAKKSNKPVDGQTDTGGKAVTRGKATAKKIEALAEDVINDRLAKKDPGLDIPIAELSPTSATTRRRMIQMGRTSRRGIFSTSGRPRNSCRRC